MRYDLFCSFHYSDYIFRQAVEFIDEAVDSTLITVVYTYLLELISGKITSHLQRHPFFYIKSEM